MHVASIKLLLITVCLVLQLSASCICAAAETTATVGVSSKEARVAAAGMLPMRRFSRKTHDAIEKVVRNPSFFRRMPTQRIDCDPEMLQLMVRRPEVLVNIWEIMGITKVTAVRTSPNSFRANDGVGTKCNCDLVYSDSQMHIYYARGEYNGSMTARRIKGRCVCVLHTRKFVDRTGESVVSGTMDVFLKLDSFGADLLTRTLGPFVGKTADYNFVETAKFVAQISQLCSRSPAAAQGLAMRLTECDDDVRKQFAGVAAKIALNSNQSTASENYPVHLPKPTNPVDTLAIAKRTQRGSLELRSASSGLSPTMARPETRSTDRPVAMPDYFSARSYDSSLTKPIAPPEGDGESAIAQPPHAIRPRKTQLFMRR